MGILNVTPDSFSDGGLYNDFEKAKEYLGKAYRLDQRINSKLDQVASLNELATKATSTLSDMPKNPNKAISTMENTICKIIDLQDEINKDIDRLVDLKTQIVTTIKNIENYEYQTLLEKRYLCFYTVMCDIFCKRA